VQKFDPTLPQDVAEGLAQDAIRNCGCEPPIKRASTLAHQIEEHVSLKEFAVGEKGKIAIGQKGTKASWVFDQKNAVGISTGHGLGLKYTGKFGADVKPETNFKDDFEAYKKNKATADESER
jgi:hypothetical protein